MIGFIGFDAVRLGVKEPVDNAIDNSALTAVYFPVKSDCARGFSSLRVDTKKGKKKKKKNRPSFYICNNILYTCIINGRKTFRLRARRFGSRVPRNRTLSKNEKKKERVKIDMML